MAKNELYVSEKSIPVLWLQYSTQKRASQHIGPVSGVKALYFLHASCKDEQSMIQYDRAINTAAFMRIRSGDLNRPSKDRRNAAF